MIHAAIVLASVGISLVQRSNPDLGPVTRRQAEKSAVVFLKDLSYSLTSLDLSQYEYSARSGPSHDLTWHGACTIYVDSWTGAISNFQDYRRSNAVQDGKRKGIKLTIETEATLRLVALEWARKLRLPTNLRSVKTVRLSTSGPYGQVIMNQKIHGYWAPGLGASFTIDRTDGQLVNYRRETKQHIVDTWKVIVPPEGLLEKAQALYAVALRDSVAGKITPEFWSQPYQSDWAKPHPLQSSRVGFQRVLPVDSRTMFVKAPPTARKHPLTFHYRIGVSYTFRPKTKDDSLGVYADGVTFDLTTGKLMYIQLHPRRREPTRRPGKPPP